MRSIITPEGTPDWAYEELRDIIGVPSWLEFDKHQNIIIDIDETGRNTITACLRSRSNGLDVEEQTLELLGRLSEYEEAN